MFTCNDGPLTLWNGKALKCVQVQYCLIYIYIYKRILSQPSVFEYHDLYALHACIHTALNSFPPDFLMIIYIYINASKCLNLFTILILWHVSSSSAVHRIDDDQVDWGCQWASDAAADLFRYERNGCILQTEMVSRVVPHKVLSLCLRGPFSLDCLHTVLYDTSPGWPVDDSANSSQLSTLVSVALRCLFKTFLNRSFCPPLLLVPWLSSPYMMILGILVRFRWHARHMHGQSSVADEMLQVRPRRAIHLCSS